MEKCRYSQHPVLPGDVSRGEGSQARAELPVAPDHPGCGFSDDREKPGARGKAAVEYEEDRRPAASHGRRRRRGGGGHCGFGDREGVEAGGAVDKCQRETELRHFVPHQFAVAGVRGSAADSPYPTPSSGRGQILRPRRSQGGGGVSEALGGPSRRDRAAARYGVATARGRGGDHDEGDPGGATDGHSSARDGAVPGGGGAGAEAGATWIGRVRHPDGPTSGAREDGDPTGALGEHFRAERISPYATAEREERGCAA